MLLEFSQYLENYLWVNYKPKLSSDAHILSIVIMINEKFRERVSAWDCFLNIDNNDKFSSFFQECLQLIISENSKLSYQEETILIKFLDNCVNSLELDLIRTQVQKICGLPMWISISQNRRDHEFKKFPKLRKFWKAIEKNDLKISDTEKELVKFERTFLKNLILKFLKNLNSFDVNQKESFKDDSLKFKMHYLERCLELFIDFEALLPTRRFFNTLLEDSNLLVQSFLSSLLKNGYEKIDTRLFNQLLKNLKFYATFEIDDHTGEAKTESECQESHYKKLKLLQRGVFKYFRDDLFAFSLTNIATIDKRDILIKHLNRLSQERLYALAEYLYLVPGKCEETQLGTLNKEILLELIICHMERKSSQLDYLNQMPLFPTEEVIWDENLVPNDFQQQSTNESCLALPKLGYLLFFYYIIYLILF
jgi:intron-binding protein aquarius